MTTMMTMMVTGSDAGCSCSVCMCITGGGGSGHGQPVAGNCFSAGAAMDMADCWKQLHELTFQWFLGNSIVRK
jgi:hypothetical protein